MNTRPNGSLDDQDEIDVIAMLRLLWDRKFIIIFVTSIFVLGSVYIALTATHVYRATVVVARVNDADVGGAASLASQFGGLASLAGVSLASGGSSREAQAILESRYLVDEFIKRNDLVSELSPAVGEPLSLWHAVRLFRETVLSIREDTTSGTTTVNINWTDPVVAANWANHFVDLVNEIIRTRALEEAARNIEYLNKQIEQTNVVGLQGVMYNLVENETKTLMLANARAEYAFTVVDPAVSPEVRSSPRRKLIVLSGSAIGLFASLMVVIIWSFVSRVRMAAVERPVSK